MKKILLIFTSIMVIVYSISTFLVDVFNELNKKESLKFKNVRLVLLKLKGISTVLLIGYTIMYVIYLFNALSVDPLLFPTLIMFGVLILNFLSGLIIKSLSKNIGELREAITQLYGSLIRVVIYLYFIYMYYILIFGI